MVSQSDAPPPSPNKNLNCYLIFYTYFINYKNLIFFIGFNLIFLFRNFLWQLLTLKNVNLIYL